MRGTKSNAISLRRYMNTGTHHGWIDQLRHRLTSIPSWNTTLHSGSPKQPSKIRIVPSLSVRHEEARRMYRWNNTARLQTLAQNRRFSTYGDIPVSLAAFVELSFGTAIVILLATITGDAIIWNAFAIPSYSEVIIVVGLLFVVPQNSIKQDCTTIFEGWIRCQKEDHQRNKIEQ